MDRFLDGVMRRVDARLNSIAQPRCATVTSFDPTQHAVRVTIQPDGVETGWLPLGAVAVGNGTGIVAPPSIGDQVLVVPQEGDSEHWHVVGRMFSNIAVPPTSPATGKPVQAGEVGVFTSGAFLHVAGGTVYASATEFRFTGDVHVDGDVYDRHGSLDRLRGHYNEHVHGSSPKTNLVDAE